MGTVNATLFNAVVGLGLVEPATEQMIDDIIDFYKPYGMKFMVQISPLAQPAELAGWLEARGFKYRDDWVKMYRRPEPPVLGLSPIQAVSTELQVRAVSAGEAEVFADTVMKGFEFPENLSALAALVAAGIGRPGWRHYLAYDGQTPVATAGLYVKDGLGWCGYGSTLPAYRRRGAQGAMFARRIADGIELGCKWLVTETDTETPDRPSPSYRNMARSGFQPAYDRPNYVWTSS
jgi:hypothetical protein